MALFLNFITNNAGLVVLTFLVIVISSITWNGYLQVQLSGLRKTQKAMFEGKNGRDLEKIIVESSNELKKIDKEIEDLYEISEKIHKIALKGIQKIGLIRFNPFKDTGGNQSFAIALLDAANSGVVISGLYARNETRVYSKPVSNGVSEFQLSDEEKDAIKKAIKPVA